MNNSGRIIAYLTTFAGCAPSAESRLNKYNNFVGPFLDIFGSTQSDNSIDRTPNRKKIKLEAKFDRITNRFVKFYQKCGVEDGPTLRRGKRSTKQQKIAQRREARRERRKKRKQGLQRLTEEEQHIKDIEEALAKLQSGDRMSRARIGDITNYDVTKENMTWLWTKIVAGFRRNFDRHVRLGSCSKKVIARLDKRLNIIRNKVHSFVQATNGWVD